MSLNTDEIDRSPLPWDTWLCPVCGQRITTMERRRFRTLKAKCPQCGVASLSEYERIPGDGRDDV